MHILSRKKRVKRIPPRKSPTQTTIRQNMDPGENRNAFGLNYDKITLKLGKENADFEDGKWLLPSDSLTPLVARIELEKLTKECRRLIEENNFLKVKMEVLMNLLAEQQAKDALDVDDVSERPNKSPDLEKY
ncbi:uncharacterized protein LOC118185528 [Stegodyphus dumicola]|uniref:uncharacterized protein LOC118185528 n=1 Tax=Stegodyphus dumicola TaxID=202533 RepID=UPI0015AF3875|nr:uncharacterized protein LOC118185528 [Stegodyphus dumicola]